MSPRARNAVSAAALSMVLALVACGSAPSPPRPVVGTELPTKPEDTMPKPGEVSPRRIH